VSGPRLPPGPRETWPFGNGRAFDRDALGFLVRAQRQFGDVLSFRLGGDLLFLLSHPDHVKHVMVDRAAAYVKPAGPPSLLTGDGLFKSEGELWKRQRAMIQPAFHREKLGALVGTIADGTQRMLDAWEARAGEPFDVADEMARLALTLMGRIVFTQPPGDRLYRATRRIVHFIGHPEQGLRRWLPFLSTRRADFAAELKVLDELAYSEIARRRQAGPASGGSGDMLDFLLAARDRDGGAMEDRQVRDEMMNLFAAGYEATAAALTWAWLLLHAHPEALKRLRDEAVAVLGDRLPTAEDVPDLRYATWTFQESMRLYAPAWLLDRQAREADQVAGYDIPEGTVVLMLPYILHRHPALWEAPEAFDPERFSPERSAGRHRFAFIPFGAGQRTCIGNNLAMIKGPLVLAMVARRYRLELVDPPARPKLHAAVTLTLEGGLRAVARPAAARA
jgi:cytochrome P450